MAETAEYPRPESSPKPPRGLGWWLTKLSAYNFATSAKWFILLIAVLPGQVEKIVPQGEKNSSWGLVFGLGAIWAILGPSLFGYWSDRVQHRRTFVLYGAALTLVALGVLATANSLVTLAIGYLMLQISDDVGTGPYGAVIPELVAKPFRGLASGVLNLATLVSHIFIAVAALAVGGSPTIVHGTLAVITLLGAVISYKAMSAERQIPWSPQPHREPFLTGLVKGWLQPWRRRDFVWVWVTRFLVALGIYLVQPYLKFYLTDAFDSYALFVVEVPSASMATTVIALTISLFGMLSATYAGRASDRIGRKSVMYVSGAVMAAALVAFLLAPNFSLLWVCAALFGVAYGAYLSAAMALAVDVLPDESTYGKDMGVWQMSTSSTQILAGATGLIVDAGNRSAPLMGYRISFGLAAFIFVLSAALVSLAVSDSQPA